MDYSGWRREEDKSQLEYIFHQQPVIISSYLIEEEEGEELVGEEIDDE